MPDTPISGLSAASPATGDYVEILDVSDTGMGVNGSNKKALLSDLLGVSHNQAWSTITGTPTTLSGYGITDAQPLDADLTALAGLSGTNTIYYRSGAGTWTAVTIGSNLTFSGGTLSASGGTPTVVTVAGESSDTTCYPLFVTAATGDLGPRTNAGLTFNSSTGELGATKAVIGFASWPTWYIRLVPNSDIAFDVQNEFGSFLFQARRTAYSGLSSYSTPNAFFVVPGILVTPTGGGSGASDVIIASNAAPGVGQTTGQIKMPAMDSGGQHRETARIVAVVTDESFGAGNAKSNIEVYAGANALAATFDGSGVDTRIKLKSGASDPTTGDVPAGYAIIWKTTTGGAVKLWCNDGGVMKSVALT